MYQHSIVKWTEWNREDEGYEHITWVEWGRKALPGADS